MRSRHSTPRASTGRKHSSTEPRYDRSAEPAGFGLSLWTSRSCIRSSGSSARATGCARSLTRSLRLPVCRSRLCRCCSQPFTSSSSVRSSCSCPRTPTHAISQRVSPGSWARSASHCSPAAACIGARASILRRILSANAPVRSMSSAPVGSSAHLPVRWPSRCPRRPHVPSRSGSLPVKRSAWNSWPSRSRSRATNASIAPTSAASSRCAAASSTSFRRPDASRCGSSSGVTRSSRCAPSRRSHNELCIPSTLRRSIRPPSDASTSSRRRSRTRTSRFPCRGTSSRRSPPGRTSSGRRTRCAACGRRKGSSRSR